MRFHKLLPDGSIDESNSPDYFSHLDSNRTRISAELFEILRFPRDAYESGRSFYNATIVGWHAARDLTTSEETLRIDGISAGRHWRWRLSFADGISLVWPAGNRDVGVGEIFYVEISVEGDMFGISLVDILRREFKVECRQVGFSISDCRAEFVQH